MNSAHVGTRRSVLQVHPSRLCNLTCAHCYSSSSPRERRSVSPAMISQAIRDASEIGFTVVSLAGGEPLVYDGLREIVRTARTVGSQVNLVSNGVLIPSARFDAVADDIEIVALSLDGLRDRHDMVRRSAGQYDKVIAAARYLARHHKQFGIIHTLTSESLDELETLAAIAAELGAQLLQVHPFEPLGRGQFAEGMTPPSDVDRLDAFLICHELGAEYPQLRIQLDLVHRDVARYIPHTIEAAPLREVALPHQLILQDDGVIVPLVYGLNRDWRVTDLAERTLAESWPSFLENTWPRLRRVLRGAAIQAARGKHGDLVPWHQVVRHHSQSPIALSAS